MLPSIFKQFQQAQPWVRWLIACLPLRLALIAAVPVVPEEAYHWNFARHLDWSYYDHPPMIAWSIAAGRIVFGDTPFGIRAVTLLFSTGTTILLARMARRFYGDRAAVWAVILFTFMPVALPVSEAGFPDSPLLFFWSLAMTLVWEAIDRGQGSSWVSAGAALGAAMLSKYTAVLLVPGILLYLICSRRDRRWLATPWPYLAGVVALIVFAPVIYWNATHDWASFLFQTQGRLEEGKGTPGRPFRFLLVQAVSYFPLTLPLLMVVVVRLFRTNRPEETYIRSCAIPIFLTFWLVSFSRPAHILWPLPGYLGILVAMSGLVEEGAGAIARFYGRWGGMLVAVSGIVLIGAGIHLTLFLPWISPMQGLYGWKEAAEAASRARSTLPESAFYLALGRKYTCASQLAYQLNRPLEVHGENLIGYGAQQYDYWSDPAALRGRDAVVVIESRRRATLMEPILGRYFDSVDRAGEVVVAVGRSPIVPAPPMEFYLYRAKGYRP